MPGFKDLLLEKGPQIAMMLLAAKQGGPQAVSGLMEGLQAKAQRREQQQRQTTLDQQAMEDRAFRRSDIEADNARADRQFKQQQFEHALALMQRVAEMQTETASDPAQVEAALQQQAGAIGGQYGVPAEQLTRFMPPAAPIIAKGVKADIAGLMEAAAAESKRRNQPYDDTTITFAWSSLKPRLQQALISAGHPEGQDVKPSTLDQLRGLVVSQAPPVAKSPTPGSFEDYLAAPPERRAEIEAARKGYMQADDRPADSVMNELRRMQIQTERQKQVDAQQADNAKRTAALQLADDMTAEIDKVLDPKTGQLTPGASAVVGWRVPGASFVPSSSAANAQAALDRVTSVLIIDLMREMKEQSKTGATGFGQLSERELSLLQSATSKLSNRNVGEAEFASELKRIRDRVSKIYQEPGGAALINPDPSNQNQAIEDALEAQGIKGRVISVREKK